MPYMLSSQYFTVIACSMFSQKNIVATWTFISIRGTKTPTRSVKRWRWDHIHRKHYSPTGSTYSFSLLHVLICLLVKGSHRLDQTTYSNSLHWHQPLLIWFLVGVNNWIHTLLGSRIVRINIVRIVMFSFRRLPTCPWPDPELNLEA